MNSSRKHSIRPGRWGGQVFAVKSQVLADGRGVASGERLVSSAEQVEVAAMLGQTLITARPIEINPLVVTEEGSFVAVSAKMIIDDNALFRYPELLALCEEHDGDESNSWRRTASSITCAWTAI